MLPQYLRLPSHGPVHRSFLCYYSKHPLMSHIAVMSCDCATLYCMLHDHLFLQTHAILLVLMANRGMTSLAATEMGVWLTYSLNPRRRHCSSASLWGFQILNNPFALYLATLFSWIFYEPSLCKYKLTKNLSTQNNFTPHTKNMQRERCLSTQRNLPTLPLLCWSRIRERRQPLWKRK